MQKEIKKSLKKLKTDYIDLYQLHHISRDDLLKRVMKKDGAYQALLDAKKKGIVKHIGITSHNINTGLKALKTGKFETIMIPYSFKNRDAEKRLLPYCKKNNIGIIIMKPLDGGATKNPTAAIKFCISKPISTVIPGIHTKKELKEDVADVLKSKLTKKEKLALKKESEKKGYYCRMCGYCMYAHGECPQKINIPFFLRAEAYLNAYGPKKWLIETCKKMPSNPHYCILCGHCESICPYCLPIMRILRKLKINKYLEKPKDIKKHKIKKSYAGKFPESLKRKYLKELNKLDNLAKKNKTTPETIYWNYKRSSNPGQKETVLKQIAEFRKKHNKKTEKKIVATLKKQMKIKNAKNLNELLMLSDYDNIVNMMRTLNKFNRKKG